MVDPMRLRRSEEHWLAQLESMGALWRHDGNPLRPHAELTSGRHSNIFFNGEKLKQRPVLLDEATYDLAEKLAMHTDLHTVDWSIGPAMGAITVAHDLARNITAITGRPCSTSYAEWQEERDGAGKVTHKWMTLPRAELEKDQGVLLAEDTCTSGDTLAETAKAVESAGGRVLPVFTCVVNRSGVEELHGRPVVSLVRLSAQSWEPEDCPLCKQNSEALRPKSAGSWARLTAKL